MRTALLILFATSAWGQDAHYRVAKNGALLPDREFTPGTSLTTDPAILCVSGYSATVRDVPPALKRAVYKAYGVKPRKGVCSGPQGCEIDHLRGLLNGSGNTMQDLWPQPYNFPGAHQKDSLEVHLRHLACLPPDDPKHITFEQAQAELSDDWTISYEKRIGEFVEPTKDGAVR